MQGAGFQGTRFGYFKVWDFTDSVIKFRGFRVQGSGFGVQGSGFRVQGSGFRILGSESRVFKDVGLRV